MRYLHNILYIGVAVLQGFREKLQDQSPALVQTDTISNCGMGTPRGIVPCCEFDKST